MHDDAKTAILNHEKAFWTALQEGNGDAAAKLTADGCVLVGAQGVSTMGPAEIKPVAEQSAGLQMKFGLDEAKAQVKMLSDDIALVAYNVTEDVVVDGKPVHVDANDASVWIKRNGEWRCAMHTESIAGDPFGRDRSSAQTSKATASATKRASPRRAER